MSSIVLYGSQIDFNNVLQIAESKSESQIKAYLTQFGSNFTERIRINFNSLEHVSVGEIFHEITHKILRYVEFSNSSDILPSLESAYDTASNFKLSGMSSNELMASNFSKHIRKLSPSDVTFFFRNKQTNVPFVFGFTFFADQYYNACKLNKQLTLDDELNVLLSVLDESWSIYVLFLALQLVDEKDMFLSALKENLMHPGRDGLGMIQSLLTPDYLGAENCESGNRHGNPPIFNRS